jgi:capsule polysaccharide export protein KpsE/RkpR
MLIEKILDHLRSATLEIQHLQERLDQAESNIADLQGKAVGTVVDPGFDMSLVPSLIPCTPGQLTRVLGQYKELFPARYRMRGPEHVQIRVLLASEIKKIRQLLLRKQGQREADILALGL